MNSSSVAACASQPRSASRASWRRRIWRGDATTSESSSHVRSAMHRAVPAATAPGAAWAGRASSRSRRSPSPTRTSRSRRPCSSRRRRPAGSCIPRRAWPTTSSTKNSAVSRLPCSRPCMSAIASRTVSTLPVGHGPAQLLDRHQLPASSRSAASMAANSSSGAVADEVVAAVEAEVGEEDGVGPERPQRRGLVDEEGGDDGGERQHQRDAGGRRSRPASGRAARAPARGRAGRCGRASSARRRSSPRRRPC